MHALTHLFKEKWGKKDDDTNWFLAEEVSFCGCHCTWHAFSSPLALMFSVGLASNNKLQLLL
jgi:hypothetical protein